MRKLAEPRTRELEEFIRETVRSELGRPKPVDTEQIRPRKRIKTEEDEEYKPAFSKPSATAPPPPKTRGRKDPAELEELEDRAFPKTLYEMIQTLPRQFKSERIVGNLRDPTARVQRFHVLQKAYCELLYIR